MPRTTSLSVIALIIQKSIGGEATYMIKLQEYEQGINILTGGQIVCAHISNPQIIVALKEKRLERLTQMIFHMRVKRKIKRRENICIKLYTIFEEYMSNICTLDTKTRPYFDRAHWPIYPHKSYKHITYFSYTHLT